MTILYLHGFASAGNGEKAQALRRRFGADQVLSPDLPVDLLAVRGTVDALLRSLSPQSTLDRGYAIVRAGDAIIRAPAAVASGDRIRVTVAEGEFGARVE